MRGARWFSSPPRSVPRWDPGRRDPPCIPRGRGALPPSTRQLPPAVGSLRPSFTRGARSMPCRHRRRNPCLAGTLAVTSWRAGTPRVRHRCRGPGGLTGNTARPGAVEKHYLRNLYWTRSGAPFARDFFGTASIARVTSGQVDAFAPPDHGIAHPQNVASVFLCTKSPPHSRPRVWPHGGSPLPDGVSWGGQSQRCGSRPDRRTDPCSAPGAR